MNLSVNQSSHHTQTSRPYNAKMDSLLSSTKSDRGLNADLVGELVDEKNKDFIHYIDDPKFERALGVDYMNQNLIEWATEHGNLDLIHKMLAMDYYKNNKIISTNKFYLNSLKNEYFQLLFDANLYDIKTLQKEVLEGIIPLDEKKKTYLFKRLHDSKLALENILATIKSPEILLSELVTQITTCKNPSLIEYIDDKRLSEVFELSHQGKTLIEWVMQTGNKKLVEKMLNLDVYKNNNVILEEDYFLDVEQDIFELCMNAQLYDQESLQNKLSTDTLGFTGIQLNFLLEKGYKILPQYLVKELFLEEDYINDYHDKDKTDLFAKLLSGKKIENIEEELLTQLCSQIKYKEAHTDVLAMLMIVASALHQRYNVNSELSEIGRQIAINIKIKINENFYSTHIYNELRYPIKELEHNYLSIKLKGPLIEKDVILMIKGLDIKKHRDKLVTEFDAYINDNGLSIKEKSDMKHKI